MSESIKMPQAVDPIILPFLSLLKNSPFEFWQVGTSSWTPYGFLVKEENWKKKIFRNISWKIMPNGSAICGKYCSFPHLLPFESYISICAIYFGKVWYRALNMACNNTAQLVNVSGGTIKSQEGKILLDYVYTASVSILHLV